MAERMGPTWAVFNGHSNDASDRAVAILEEFYPSWAEEIKKAQEKGIMVIFDKEPTPATAAFSMLVTAFVNEDKEQDNAKTSG